MFGKLLARGHKRLGLRSITCMLGVFITGILAPSQQARSESILFELDSVAPSGPNWEWKYKVELTGLSELWKGPSSGSDVYTPDFIDLFDFGPTVGTPTFTASAGGFANGDFGVSQPLDDYVATTAIFGYGASELLDDDASVANIRLTFDNNTPFANPTNNTLTLGTLSAISANDTLVFDTYIATDTK